MTSTVLTTLPLAIVHSTTTPHQNPFRSYLPASQGYTHFTVGKNNPTFHIERAAHPSFQILTMATVISSSPPKEKGFLDRTGTNKLNATEGTLYVSKPYRTKDSRKPRALITFTPRKSVFDINNEASGVNEFRVSDSILLHGHAHLS